METFGKKLSFGLGVMNAGQRNVNSEPELIAVSSAGGFRITAAVSKALGLAHGDYVMFITNRNGIDKAIAEKDEQLVAFCEERGLDITTEAAYEAIHTEFDVWGLAKGVAKFDAAGNPVLSRERIGSDVKKRYVEEHFEELIAQVNESKNEELKAAINREGITEEEVKKYLGKLVQGDEVQKFEGSKTANTSLLTGVGVPLTFTDSNIWNILKSDLSEPTKINKIYSVDVANLQDAPVNNGFETVNVKVAILGASRIEKPVRVGDKKADGTTVTEEESND